MNKFIGIGRLTDAPEIRQTQTGKAVASFTIAIDDGWGENRSTDFLPVTCWEKLAENCGKFLGKGSKVGVVGKVKKRSYDKNGTKVWVTEIVASEVEFLDTKAQTAENAAGAYGNSAPRFEEVGEDDDIPF
jgi:single-strand DNA-binding protein